MYVPVLLGYAQLVDSRVGIHLEQAATQEVMVGVGQVGNLGELSRHICLELLPVGRRVFVGMCGSATKHVESHIVGWIETVAAPYLLVEAVCHCCIELVLWHVLGQSLEP